jgi:protein O-GlcNAc transferase
MHRPARAIVGWFGLFATSGIAGYDVIIGDDVGIPAVEERFYCERRLPSAQGRLRPRC